MAWIHYRPARSSGAGPRPPSRVEHAVDGFVGGREVVGVQVLHEMYVGVLTVDGRPAGLHQLCAPMLDQLGAPLRAGQTTQGLDLTYATNHLGPFAFTDALMPHLGVGTNIVFITSAVEDPERKPAVRAGFRGGRFIAVEASARGEWASGGSTKPGYDAYATAKQGNLATVLAMAREFPHHRFRAIEPGLNPGTGLGRDAGPAWQILARLIAPLGAVVPTWSTPKRAANMITGVLTDPSGASGAYYNENGAPMRASKQISDPAFSDLVVAETRDFLAKTLSEAT